MMTLEYWLKEKPFTLSLSSRYFGFFSHCGFILALEERGIRPALLTGASAGALVAGLWASGMTGQEIKTELLKLRRSDFWDPGIGAGLLKGQLFRSKLIELLCSPGTQKNMEDCTIPIQVSAHNIFKNRTEIIRNGNMVNAIYASCALPGLFHPIKINGTYYTDGGVKDKEGFSGVGYSERTLLHYLDSKSPWRLSKFPSIESFVNTQLKPKLKLKTILPRTMGASGSQSEQGLDRSNIIRVQLADLPRSGPFKLHVGLNALDTTYQKTQKMLDHSADSVFVEQEKRDQKQTKNSATVQS